MNVVITGANKGLGLCLVKIFAENNHNVIAGVYEKDDTSKLFDYINSHKYSGKIIPIPMDIIDEEMIKRASEEAYNRLGYVDVVINNAGILLPKDRTDTILEMDIDVLRKSIEVNTIGTVIVIKHFYKIMRKDGKGMMILVTSEAGSMINTGANFPAYSISKAAANKAVFILRETVKSDCIVYAMHPGRMNTDMGRETAQIEPEESAEGIYKIATGKTNVVKDSIGFINYKGEPMTI